MQRLPTRRMFRVGARRLQAAIAAGVLLASVGSARAVPPDRISETFDGYAAGPPPASAWQARAFSWTVLNGRLRGGWMNSTFAFPVKARIYRSMTVEVTVIPRRKQGKAWKIAALAVVRDSHNFWHLGLVESPNEDGSRHFVELCEMRNGRWLSQQSLKSLVHRGNEFHWRYDTPYRLRIVLGGGKIEGTVVGPDGKECARIAYEFDKPAVDRGRPALRVVAMEADFDDFRMEADPVGAESVPVREVEEKKFPPYAVRGSGAPAPGGATGFFRTVQKDGRWWLVDPRGELFYAVGTDHVNYRVHWCRKLGYAPYNKNCEKKYGSPDRWAETAARRLREWGFNLLGANNSPEVRYRGLAHTLFAAFGSTFSGYSALVDKVHWTGFPNVFDPKWEAWCMTRAEEVCKPNRNDPWLLGYFLDNELEWWGKTHSEVGIFIDTMKKPADHSGKQALVDFLRKRHGSIAEFNRVWGESIRSWDELLRKAELTAENEEARAAQRAFVALVADRYFSMATKAIRAHDPNHLVIGCRFAGNAPEAAWKACAKYCDVVTFNYYPRIDFESGDLSELAERFEEYFQLTNRPLMITEWSFPALDAGLPCKHGAGMRVDTQEQKARCFTLMQHLLFRLPFMVGSDYFMWVDEPALGISDTFPEDSNYGLVDVNDRPWPELTEACRRLNPLAFRLHAGAIPEVYVRQVDVSPKGIRVILENLAEVPGRPAVRVTVQEREYKITADVAPHEKAEVLLKEPIPPGFHAVDVQLERARDVPLGCRGLVKMLAGVYVPGAPWPPDERAGARLPILVLNPTSCPLEFAPVAVEAEGLPGSAESAARLVTRNGIVAVARPGENVLAWCLSALRERSAVSGFIYPGNGGAGKQGQSVRTERLGARGFVIRNGLLELRNEGRRGNVLDVVALEGLVLGSYNPVVWQDPGQNQWTRADHVETVEVRSSGEAVIVTVVCRGGAAEAAITAVDDKGRQAARRARPIPFRVAHQFVVWPRTPYFLTRVLWVENAARERPLLLKGVFFYLLPSIGGSPAEDAPGGGPEVPNYWRRSAAAVWEDATAGGFYGAFGLVRGQALKANFWKDEGGGFHPDARIEVKPPVRLAPGQRWRGPSGEWLVVFGARRGSRLAAWESLERFMYACPRLVVKTADVERR